jgi:hypothetical protein
MKRSHSVFLSSSDDEAFKTDADCSENPSRNPDVILEQDRFLPIGKSTFYTMLLSFHL